MVKSCKQRGFRILSYNPSRKIVEMQLPSEFLEESVNITVEQREEDSRIRLNIQGPRFEKGFYDRMNPKTIVEFLALGQE